MATGILSVLLHTSPHKFNGEATTGTVLYFATIVLFLLFSLASIARYTLFPWAVSAMLRHPAQSLFLGAIPLSLTTIVIGTAIIAGPHGQWAADLSWALWWLDVLLTVLCVFGIPLLMFQVHHLELDTMNGIWVMPFLPAIICAAAGGEVASILSMPNAQITLFVSYALWGTGMTLSVLVMALYFQRLAVYKLPNPEVTVSAFLPLGCCGQGAYALLATAQAGRVVFNDTQLAGVSSAGNIALVVSVIIGLMIWGLGLWWLVHGMACVLIRMYAEQLEFNMGFWGFAFPVGTFVAATNLLGQLLPSAFFSYLAVVLLAVYVILCVTLVAMTVRAGVKRQLFVSPCLSDLKQMAETGSC